MLGGKQTCEGLLCASPFLLVTFSFLDLFIYLLGSQREEEIEIFQLLTDLPNGLNGQGLARLKLEAWSVLQVSHVGAGPNYLDCLLPLSQAN